MKIEATHSDGDGFINLRLTQEENESFINISKNEAMTLMAELAMAISDEFGEFSSYGYPGCKAAR